MASQSGFLMMTCPSGSYPSQKTSIVKAYNEPHTINDDPEKVFHGPGKGSPILDLPTDIYNLIMALVLKPGIVYPQARSQEASSNPGPGSGRVSSTVSSPGFQILATCKKVYSEGIPMFYAGNTFCLPRGPVGNTIMYFESLLPRHR